MDEDKRRDEEEEAPAGTTSVQILDSTGRATEPNIKRNKASQYGADLLQWCAEHIAPAWWLSLKKTEAIQALMLLATAAYSFIAVWQLVAMNRQLSQMTAANNNTSEQIALARRQFESSERAWVVADIMSAGYPPTHPFVVNFTIRNAGRGTASNVQSFRTFEARDVPMEAAIESWAEALSPVDNLSCRVAIAAANSYAAPSILTLGPETPFGSAIEERADFLSEGERQQILAGTRLLYFHGIIRYGDQFSGDRGYSYCLVFDSEPTGGKAHTWRTCPVLNYSW